MKKNNFLLITKYSEESINGKLKKLENIIKNFNKNGDYSCYAYIKDKKENLNFGYYKIYIYGSNIKDIQFKQSKLEIEIGIMNEFTIYEEEGNNKKIIISYKK
ncbi:MAG: hypothetical protein QW117_01245 [Candidatus Pacearchaeota archaeon]